MRIKSVDVENFRCLHELHVDFDSTTVFIGPNGSGKSSVLYALRWFFEGGPLELEDFTCHDDTHSIRVGVTFADLTPADLIALGSYALGDEVTLWRIWEVGSGEKLTGRAYAYPQFEGIRAHASARDLRAAYDELRTTDPELGLPTVTSKVAAEEAMRAWERSNPGALEPAEISATHLFGIAGQPRLAGRFDYVLVPAVAEVASQIQDARGTLLRQLIERAAPDSASLQERLHALQLEAADMYSAIVEEEQAPSLADLAEVISAELSVLVRDARVSLSPMPSVPNFATPRVNLTVHDGDLPTDVTRQGHGMQRSLLFALEIQISRATSADDAPGLCIAIEEPELYQHPVQARHFAQVLASLPQGGESAIQVVYATHNEHFVDARHFERLRRLGRSHTADVDCGVSQLSTADPAGVAALLGESVLPDELGRRISLTLSRALAEAVFAPAVLLVEGRSDSAVLAGVADRQGGFDLAGVSVVPIGGKTQLSLAYAILHQLQIPTYVVFDGDAGIEARMIEQNKAPEDARSEAIRQANSNRSLLRILGASEEDFPDSQWTPAFAVFGDTIDSELQGIWPEMLERAASIALDSGDWREKPEECWREAAATVGGEVPAIFQGIVSSVMDLVQHAAAGE